VLGLLAWEGGVIGEQLFVAIVVLAIVTSALAGPMLKWLLKLEKPWSLGGLIDARNCVPNMTETTARESIARLCQLAAEKAKLDVDEVTRQVLARESRMGTGLEHGIAVPHARLENLATPVLAVGTSAAGIPFDGVVATPAHLIFLILTPAADPASQLQVLAAIGRFAQDRVMLNEALAARTPVELLGAFKVAEALQPQL
jgi:mannitol/fructose-specific phosphotransferase system IIA component (Ntr-type)